MPISDKEGSLGMGELLLFSYGLCEASQGTRGF